MTSFQRQDAPTHARRPRPARLARHLARLSAIDAGQRALIAANEAQSDDDWSEASQFNLDARNAEWRRLEAERAVTLAS